MYLSITCLVCWAVVGASGYWVVERGQDQGYPVLPEYERDDYSSAYPPQEAGYGYYPTQEYSVPSPYPQPPPVPQVRIPGWPRPVAAVPVVVRLPNAHTIVIPVRAVYTFPPFIERLVQRIQTYYSVFNPPESLTIDRPVPAVQTTPQTAPVTVQEAVPEATPIPTAEGIGDKVKPDEQTTSEGEKPTTQGKVSTLAVYEVTPTSEEDATPTAPPDTTTDSDNYISPETLSPADLPEGYNYEVPSRNLGFNKETGINSSDYDK